MKPDDLAALLAEFTAERQALLARHEAAARVVSEYDSNNTYQYIIAREDVHLSWLHDALAGLEGDVPVAGVPAPPRPDGGAPGSRQLLEDAAAGGQAFVEKWRGAVARVSHARHRLMLDVILGETFEHARLFAQAAAGRTDLLGRRPEGTVPIGRVLPTRWVE